MKLKININKLTPELADELVELWVRILRTELANNKKFDDWEKDTLASINESQRRTSAAQHERLHELHNEVLAILARDKNIELERRASELTKKAFESVQRAVEQLAAIAEALDLGCTLPPPGWFCSRAPGHEGPCAARAKPSS